MLTVMLFNGGLMPTYYIVSKTKLIDTVWALIIPGAVPIFNCIVLMNFFRGIPSELEESAKLDGASQWQILMADLYSHIQAVSGNDHFVQPDQSLEFLV